MHEKSPHFWSEGETHLLLNTAKDLDIDRFVDMQKYFKADLLE